jgi:hypothetical protein
MKRVHAALMFVLALGLFARPGVTQTAPHKQGQPVQQEIQQMNNATATNEGHGHTYQLAELATPTIKATSTPPQSREQSSGKRHRVESHSSQKSKEEWARCLQNDACHVRNLFADKWDRLFGGPVNVFNGD